MSTFDKNKALDKAMRGGHSVPDAATGKLSVDVSVQGPEQPKERRITAQILKTIAPSAPKDVEKFIKPLNDTMERYDINTLQRAAMFLAQLAQESGEFKYVREIWGPTKAQKNYEPPSDKAKELGNIRPSDGKRFMGRGLIQITGRGNYVALSRYLGIDFAAYPEKLEEPHWAVLAAGWFWMNRKLNGFADLPASWRSATRNYTPFQYITYRINGAQSHQAEREKFYARAIVVLSPLFS